ncbi:hypothetical protein ABG794_15075 [Enterobacter soli]|uniref:hypothetical protein n=1 Tax=Enterobacter soli TaxID=885040 RepID=UPI00325AAB86
MSTSLGFINSTFSSFAVGLAPALGFIFFAQFVALFIFGYKKLAVIFIVLAFSLFAFSYYLIGEMERNIAYYRGAGLLKMGRATSELSPIRELIIFPMLTNSPLSELL